MNEISKRKNRRKILKGKVISNKMDKTVKVVVVRRFKHPKYEKIVSDKTSAIAHNELENIKIGDIVRIMECRPISKTKRWVVLSKEIS